MNEYEFKFEEFRHWYRMEILTREFPDVPVIKLFLESISFGGLL